MGYVSSQLHLDYRVNCSVLDVIISGFFDSIGIYQQVPEAIRLKAMQWLARLNLTHLAKSHFVHFLGDSNVYCSLLVRW